MMTNLYIHRDPRVGLAFLSQVRFEFDGIGKEHTHPETQYLSILRGSVDIRIGLQHADLQAGDVAVIGAGVRHAIPATDQATAVELLDLRILDGDTTELSSFIRSHPHAAFTRVPPHQLKRLAQQLADATARPAPENRAPIMAGVWSLLAMLCASSDPSAGSALERRIAVAERFMLERLKEPVSAEDIAEACALSVSQLNRLYRSHAGIGPAERLRLLRVQRNCWRRA